MKPGDKVETPVRVKEAADNGIVLECETNDERVPIVRGVPYLHEGNYCTGELPHIAAGGKMWRLTFGGDMDSGTATLRVAPAEFQTAPEIKPKRKIIRSVMVHYADDDITYTDGHIGNLTVAETRRLCAKLRRLLARYKRDAIMLGWES
jgi:hypothetical protein